MSSVQRPDRSPNAEKNRALRGLLGRIGAELRGSRASKAKLGVTLDERKSDPVLINGSGWRRLAHGDSRNLAEERRYPCRTTTADPPTVDHAVKVTTGRAGLAKGVVEIVEGPQRPCHDGMGRAVFQRSMDRGRRVGVYRPHRLPAPRITRPGRYPMMLPGGSANKLGNRYEKWWTVSQLVRMLGGEVDAIRIEDPDAEKAEFVVTVGSRRELHQVKRVAPKDNWTLTALNADGLLRKIGEQLANNNVRFVFASGSGARHLSKLCDAANSAESTEEFERFSHAAKEERSQPFKKLLLYSAGKPGVLIVDQLDAVSTMSGRGSDAFDLVEQLLHEARGTRARVTIHTVVVCRAFDWEHDPRLRKLMPPGKDPVEVTEFSVDEVKTILARADFDLGLFRSRQLELLRVPQNLLLFLEAGFEKSHKPEFGSATDLFDRYWNEKRQAVAARVAQPVDYWMDVVDTLCDEMTANQQLSVPREKLDKIPPAYLDQLASEGVLTVAGNRYGFGHESFFDYCFARVFFRRSESLVSFLKESEQHLFRRAQVRQVLAYLRDHDADRYIRELGGLLADADVRTHIKDLAFAFLADVTEPTEQEWNIWNGWIPPAIEAIKDGARNSNELSVLAWRRFAGSPSWFADANQRGLIRTWLSSGSERLADMAVSYLTGHQRHSPDQVAAIMEPYAGRGGVWAQRLRSLVERAQHHASRRFFDFVLRLVANGTLDEARRPSGADGTFWRMFYNLGEERPEWVPELLADYLRRRLAVVRRGGDVVNERMIGYDDYAGRLFAKSAASAPAEFVRRVLPPVLEIADLAVVGDERPKRDTVWPTRIATEHPRGDQACVMGLASALAAVASQETARLQDVVGDLRRRDTYIANYLLLSLYGGASARYADEAALLLCDEPWRFQCGFAGSSNWCAVELIRAIVPHCATSNRMLLERAIMGYTSRSEGTVDGLKYRQIGRARFNLLSAIPGELRSRRANSHFDDAEVSSSLKLRVCGKAFAESRVHCGRAIADVLGAIGDLLPERAIGMLDWLATEHDDPVKEAWREEAGGGQSYYNGDIHMNGINTARGRAAEAVQALILKDAAYVTRFRPTIERMIRDRSAAVLSCVAGTLRAVASRDPALGVSLFLRMNLDEERLLATRHVTGMIRSNLRHSRTYDPVVRTGSP